MNLRAELALLSCDGQGIEPTCALVELVEGEAGDAGFAATIGRAAGVDDHREFDQRHAGPLDHGELEAIGERIALQARHLQCGGSGGNG